MENQQIQVLTESFEGHAQNPGAGFQTILLAPTKWLTLAAEVSGRSSHFAAEDVRKVERRLSTDEKKALINPDTLDNL